MFTDISVSESAQPKGEIVYKTNLLLQRGFLYMRIFKYTEVLKYRPFILICGKKQYFWDWPPHVKKPLCRDDLKLTIVQHVQGSGQASYGASSTYQK